MTPAEMGARDGAKLRASLTKRGRELTPIGACRKAGVAFMNHVEAKRLPCESFSYYGTAFVNTAMGVSP